MTSAPTLALLPQLLAAGIVGGGIYGLVALGLVIVFKTTGIINFAHGSTILLGGYLAVWAVGPLGLPYGAAVALAVAAAAAVGWTVDRIAYRRLLAAPHMIQVLATLAVANVLNGAVTMVWGAGSHAFPPSGRMRPLLVQPVVITGQQALIVLCALLLGAALSLFFAYGRWGRAMRALSQNAVGANLCGIRTSRVFTLSVVLSAALGAAAGALYGPLTLIDPSFGSLLIKGFAAASLGGLTSLPGAVVGGLVLGLCESLWAALLPALWVPSISYLVIIVVLLARPSGLFGEAAIRKL